VICIRGNKNIKNACKEIGWDISDTGLQIQFKENQLADSSAQVLLMCVPSVFDCEGLKGEIYWHFSDTEKSLLNKGTLPTEYVGKPLPRIKLAWQQSKQGKGRNKAEKKLSLNDLVGFQQNGCLVCTVESAKSNWKRLAIPWEKFNKIGLCRRSLGRKPLMVIDYGDRPTDRDRVTLQRLQRCNVVYSYNLSSVVLAGIATVHKQVKVNMSDGSPPPYKFTNLCREAMSLKVTDKDGVISLAVDAIIPILSGLYSGGATLMYHTDSIMSAALAQKIKRSPAGRFIGYWGQTCKYKVGMITKLMESFTIDAAALAEFLVFDPATLEIQTGLDDKDDFLESVEADLGIDQGWTADTEGIVGVQVDVSGYREALARTLRDRPDDINNDNKNRTSRRTNFSQSTGNSTNNLDATTCCHTLKEKARKNIALVNKNATLANDLTDFKEVLHHGGSEQITPGTTHCPQERVCFS
jgi:hypothetical protein